MTRPEAGVKEDREISVWTLHGDDGTESGWRVVMGLVSMVRAEVRKDRCYNRLYVCWELIQDVTLLQSGVRGDQGSIR